MEITMIGRFEEACRHQGFCPAPYMSESMAEKAYMEHFTRVRE